MKDEGLSLEPIRKELANLQITREAIAELSVRYMPLVIKGIDDKEGFDIVHKARIDIKNRRVSVQKTCKKARESAVQYQKDVIGLEKNICALLQPMEDHLSDEESRVQEEIDRIKREAVEREAAILQARVNRLFAMGCRFDGENYSYANLTVPQALIKVCTDEQFDTFVAEIQKVINKEIADRAEEERKRKEEAERLALIAKEQEAERQRLAEEARKIQAEKDRLAKEQRDREEAAKKAEDAKQRAEEIEKARAEAAEKARIQEQGRVKREAEEKARKEEATRIRAEKREARRPDKEKLINFLGAISLETPIFKTEEGVTAAFEVIAILQKAITECRAIVDKL